MIALAAKYRPARTLLLLLLGGSLSGCYSFPTQTFDGLKQAYLGQHADTFFERHGPPIASFGLADGGTMYTWSSGVREIRLPSTTHTTLYNTGYGTYSGSSYTAGGGTLRLFCELRITADHERRIRSIVLSRDTIGWLKLSRFAEIFKAYKYRGRNGPPGRHSLHSPAPQEITP